MFPLTFFVVIDFIILSAFEMPIPVHVYMLNFFQRRTNKILQIKILKILAIHCSFIYMVEKVIGFYSGSFKVIF